MDFGGQYRENVFVRKGVERISTLLLVDQVVVGSNLHYRWRYVSAHRKRFLLNAGGGGTTSSIHQPVRSHITSCQGKLLECRQKRDVGRTTFGDPFHSSQVEPREIGNAVR